MLEEFDRIELSGADQLITHNPNDAYRVTSGTVLVYIVPWVKGMAGRRILLGEVPEGRVIPSLSFKDKDYREWRFCLIAKSTASLSCLPSSVTSVLKKNFVTRIGVEAAREEGFENGLVEFYQRELVKDNIFISKGAKRESEVNVASYGIIKNAFNDKTIQITGDNPSYRAVAYACHYLSIDMISLEKAREYCGKHIDIPSLARASHVICREIVLEPSWHRKDMGVIIGTLDKQPVTCVPRGRNGYNIYDPITDTIEKLTAEKALRIEPKAYYFGKTLENKCLKLIDLIKFGKNSYSKADLFALLLLGMLSVIIGVLLPTLNQQIYDDYIPLGNIGQLTQICVVVASFMVGNLFFEIVKRLTEFRTQSRIGYAIQDAVYDRLFYLPEDFFRKYDSADLAQRVIGLEQIVNKFVSTIIVSGFAFAFSFIYFVRMFIYSGALAWVSLLMISVYAVAIVLIGHKRIKFEKESSENDGQSSSKLYQYLSGIEKIRMAGVEDRAIYEYLLPFSRSQIARVKQNRFSAIMEALQSVASSLFSLCLYYILIKSNISISMGAFIGFNTALGCFSSATLQMMEAVLEVYQCKPVYERVKPILETCPERQSNSELPGRLSGNIDIDHVTFSYGKDLPVVLNDISIQIKAGEYIGIVGASGCGKSTLLKLLLGFETPETGAIRYDGKSLASLDKQAFRKNLGVVLQNGKLIAGSIYENITITSPNATMEDVQKVIEAVGLKDDISKMPMGIHTVLSENSSTISGGQQQRILIARAILRKPAILFFDEATSALDNVTQASVCESLDKMNVTRVVIAHRLSTIRSCDKIIVLQGGRIAEEGTYDTLMQKNGLFYQLANRQIAE